MNLLFSLVALRISIKPNHDWIKAADLMLTLVTLNENLFKISENFFYRHDAFICFPKNPIPTHEKGNSPRCCLLSEAKLQLNDTQK